MKLLKLLHSWKYFKLHLTITVYCHNFPTSSKLPYWELSTIWNCNTMLWTSCPFEIFVLSYSYMITSCSKNFCDFLRGTELGAEFVLCVAMLRIIWEIFTLMQNELERCSRPAQVVATETWRLFCEIECTLWASLIPRM